MADVYYADPLHVFRFKVEFTELPGGGDLPLCSGMFSEVTGLEATMEPKTIKEGGRNYGPAQRAGQVSFGTVVLKRGITEARNLWQWYELVNRQGKYAYRLNVTILLQELQPAPASGLAARLDVQPEPRVLVKWTLDNALPVKFKAPELNAAAGQVGIEELHLVHEGLNVLRP